MQKNRIPGSIMRRIGALKQRHSRLDNRISAEFKRPQPDPFLVQRYKRIRLSVKDEISQLLRGAGNTAST